MAQKMIQRERERRKWVCEKKSLMTTSDNTFSDPI